MAKAAVAKICDFTSLVIGGVTVVVALRYSLAPAYPERGLEIPGFQNSFLYGLAISGTAGLFEASFSLVATAAPRPESRSPNDRRCGRLNGLATSKVMTFVYMFLFCRYLLITLGYDYMAKSDSLASGTRCRPVSMARYVEWSINVPVLIVLSGRLPIAARAKDEDPSSVWPIFKAVPEEIRAAASGTFAYVWLSWLSLLIQDGGTCLIMVAMAFVGYAMCSASQLYWAWTNKSSLSGMRIGLIVFQVVLFGLYGIVFLAAMVDGLDPVLEQVLYMIGDMTAKVVHSLVLSAVRMVEDMNELQELSNEAAALADDIQRVLNSSSAPIYSLTQEGNIAVWNEKMSKLTDVSSEEAKGQSFVNFVASHDRTEAQRIVSEILSGNAAPALEISIGKAASISRPSRKSIDGGAVGRRDSVGRSNSNQARKGPMAKITVSMTPQRDAHGQISGVFGVGQDLTEIEAVKQAEARKTRFMAVVSHELRSPLHGIIGLTQSMHDSEKDKDRRKKMYMVKNCASRLLDLVANVMEMASLQADQTGKVEAKPKPLARDPVELSRIIAEVVTFIGNATNKTGDPLLRKSVQLINKCPDTLPIIEGDAHKCTQVFYNLVTNACKFTKEGSVVISAELHVDDQIVDVHVTDTGIGISPDALGRIFEPFEQEETTEARTYEGIGLGLSIAKEVVQKHGGTLNVKSELGNGSTFTVSLPCTMQRSCSESQSQTDGLTSQPEEGRSATKDSMEDGDKAHSTLNRHSARFVRMPSWKPVAGPTVVLSVDDDYVNQEVIKGILEDSYHVILAMDGTECLDKLQASARLPDVILMDVMMPGKNGFEVVETIRNELQFSEAVLPIIMLSARSPIGVSIARGLSVGCNDYVAKPFEKEVLRARVASVLKIKRLHEVEVEHVKNTQLLYSIMPPHIVERLQGGEHMVSESHDKVTILFSDIVGWTNIAETLTTSQIVVLLNELFSAFDELTEKHGVFKVETIGDAYMCAAGHDKSTDHAKKMLDFGLDMLEAVKSVHIPMPSLQLRIRVGVHTGSAYTGVVGKKVPRYCFFGDTVNVSSRMESNSLPGFMHISQATRDELGDIQMPEGVRILDRGFINIKGKGEMATHLICPVGVPAPTLSGSGTPTKSSEVCSFSMNPKELKAMKKHPNGNIAFMPPSIAEEASTFERKELQDALSAAGVERRKGDETRRALEEALAKKIELEAEGQTLLEELEELKEFLKEKESSTENSSKLKEELNDAQKRNNSFEEEQSRLQQELEDAQAGKDHCEEEKSQLRGELEKAQTGKHSCEKEKSRLRRELEEALQGKDSLELDETRLKQELREALQKKGAFELDQTRLKQELETASAKVSLEGELRSSLKAELSTEQSACAALRSEGAEARRKVDRAEEAATFAERRCKELEQQVSALAAAQAAAASAAHRPGRAGSAASRDRAESNGVAHQVQASLPPWLDEANGVQHDDWATLGMGANPTHGMAACDFANVGRVPSMAAAGEITTVLYMLDKKEQELQHARLELRLKDRQLAAAREELAAKTRSAEATELDLQHMLLDSRQSLAGMGHWRHGPSPGGRW